MATGLGDGLDQELTDFLGEGAQFEVAQRAKIGR